MNKAWSVGLIAAAALSGCSSLSKEAQERNPAPCPNVVVLQDAGRQVVFDGDETVENVAYSAEVENVSTACRYFGDEPIHQAVNIDIAFGRGPKGSDSDRTFTYFVAVTRKDTDVISKQTFTVPVHFGDKSVVRVKEKVGDIVIPRKDKNISGTNFEVIVGMELTREQVIFNRSGKSLKFPNL